MDRISFKSLPHLCSNDLVHGSWWFCIGSAISTIIPCIPLLDSKYNFFNIPGNTELDAYDQNTTWILMILSGLSFTFGSYALVRSFEYPVIAPIFQTFFQNDLVLSGWLFYLGSIPFTVYTLIFVYWYPYEFHYYVDFIFSFVFTSASVIFLYACYSSNEDTTQYIHPAILSLFGNSRFVQIYLYNDWIIVSWFCYICTLFWLLGSVTMLILCIPSKNERQLYLYSSSAFNSVIFLIGCAYYCTGESIPHMKSIRTLYSKEYDSTTIESISDLDVNLFLKFKNEISNNIL